MQVLYVFILYSSLGAGSWSISTPVSKEHCEQMQKAVSLHARMDYIKTWCEPVGAAK